MDTIFTIMKVGFSLIGVLLLAYVSTRALATVSRRKGRTMELLDTCVIGKDKSIHLVKVGQRLLLIGTAGSHITNLLEFDEKEAENIMLQLEETSGGSQFDKLLGSIVSGREGEERKHEE